MKEKEYTREFNLRSRRQDKEVEAVEEVMLEIPPEWNAVPDLIMEDKEGMMITETDTNLKRDK